MAIKKSAKQRARKREVKQEKAEKKEPLPSNEDVKKRQEKQIRIIMFWVVLVMVFTISFVLFYRNASNFTYRGIKFQRENMNGLVFYKTNLQFTRQDGTFTFALYTRNDPRKLEKIPINATIVLKKGGFVSFEPRVSSCYASNIAANELGTVLAALGMKVRGATTDSNTSETKNVELKTCNDTNLITGVVLESSNRSFIEQEGNCYTLHIANCDIIAVAERFIFETIFQLSEQTKEKLNSAAINTSVK